MHEHLALQQHMCELNLTITSMSHTSLSLL